MTPARVGAEAEAVVVAQQAETAWFLPAPARRQLVGELVCQARHVIEQSPRAVGEEVAPPCDARGRAVA